MRSKALIARIIEIAQTDGELMTDGECLDEIVIEILKAGYDIFDRSEYLQSQAISKSRKRRFKAFRLF